MSSVTAALTAVGVTNQLSLKPGESAKYSVTGTFTGFVNLERSSSPLSSFATLVAGAEDTGISGTVTNETKTSQWFRFRATTLGSGTALVTLAENAAVVRTPTDLDSREDLATNGDAATAVGLDVYQTHLGTSGSGGAEDLTIGDGTGAVIGQRKLIVLDTLGDAGDSVTLDDENMSKGTSTITAVALDAAGEFLLLEFQGVTWEVIKASSGVVTTS